MTMLRISASVRPAPSLVCCVKPRLRRLSVMAFAPTFEVMTTTALRKFTFRPSESVSWPSSMTCSRRLNTSSCAFSISSNSTTEYGLRRTFSVSWPPSSWPI